MAQYSVNWSAVLSSTTTAVSVGACLVAGSDGTYSLGTTANRGTKRCDGIAVSAGDSTNRSVVMVEFGPITATVSGLGSGTASWVRVSSAGVLERCTPASGDDIVGWCETDGSCHVAFGFLPVLPDSGTVVGLTDTQTLTNKTLTSPVLTTPQINDTSLDHQYVFAVNELAADRTVTLPLLTGNDIFVFEAHSQTLTNKTITSPSISSPTISSSPVVTATSWEASGNARLKIYSNIANVTTTDATVTSIYTWTITDEAVTTVTAEVSAVQSDGSTTASYVRRVRIKRDGGTVTVGTVEDTYTSEEAGFSTCDVTIDNDTSTGRVRVTGVAATTINWGVVVTRQEMTHA